MGDECNTKDFEDDKLIGDYNKSSISNINDKIIKKPKKNIEEFKNDDNDDNDDIIGLSTNTTIDQFENFSNLIGPFVTRLIGIGIILIVGNLVFEQINDTVGNFTTADVVDIDDSNISTNSPIDINNSSNLIFIIASIGAIILIIFMIRNLFRAFI